jgi:hypothetical protein
MAFAGAGAPITWCRATKLGTEDGACIPNIVSPITGEEEVAPGLGYTFPTNEESLRRWKRWWRVANQEQFFLFYVISLFSLLTLSVLAI